MGNPNNEINSSNIKYSDKIVTENQTIQPTRNKQIKEELNNLYSEIYEVQAESQALWREQDNYKKRINNLESALEHDNLTRSQRQNIQAELNINRSYYAEALERYEKANKTFTDMNQRIYELETGNTDKAPFVNWLGEN